MQDGTVLYIKTLHFCSQNTATCNILVDEEDVQIASKIATTRPDSHLELTIFIRVLLVSGDCKKDSDNAPHGVGLLLKPSIV